MNCPRLRPSSALPLSAWDGLVLLTVSALWLLIRLSLIPPFPELTDAVSHDSSYLLIVAENLLHGRGFINDAHWLVFVNPPSLPMPFHNANPLYIILTAAVMAFEKDPATAGLFVSSCASALLFLSISLIARRFVSSLLVASSIGLLTVLFPPLFSDSLRVLTDHLATSLFTSTIALLFLPRHPPRIVIPIAAGCVFGLAWLARSQTILAAPALLLFFVVRYGLRTGAQIGTLFFLSSLLVALPWLQHNLEVFGAWSTKDSSYYIVQDLEADARFGGDVERYWHSTTLPRTLGEIVKSDPTAFLIHFSKGVMKVSRTVLGFCSGHSMVVLGLLIIYASICTGYFLRRRTTKDWSLVTVLILYLATLVGIFSIRGASAEIRYFSTFTCWVPLLLLLGTKQLPVQYERVAFVFAYAVLLSLVVLRSIPLIGSEFAIDSEKVKFRTEVQQIQQLLIPEKPVVVGSHPYFFTRATGFASLSMPEAADTYLESYMEHYGAQNILLSDKELSYWKPHWAQRLPSFLYEIPSGTSLHLFRLRENTP